MTSANRAKALLRRAIENQSEEQYKDVIGALLQKHDIDTVINWVIDDVLPQVDAESMMWAYRLMLSEKEMASLNDEAKTFMVQSLIEKGFQFGVDFSFTSENHMVANTNVTESLIADIPDHHKDYYRSKIIKVEDSPQIILERHLGVPFVDNLVRIVGERMPSMDDDELHIYLLTMIIGVESRTKINLLEVLVNELRKVYPERILKFLFDVKYKNDWDFDIDTHCGIDLVKAAGGEKEIIPHPTEPGHMLISRKGLTLLAQVYEGENSVYELIGELDAEVVRRGK